MTVAREITASAERYVREQLEGDSSGHDWWHVDRVRRLALRLAREEGADELVVELAALLHDVADYKFSGSAQAGPEAAADWLRSQGVDSDVTASVAEIVAGVSFQGAGVADAPLSLEGRCVRDADRLDAIGAIGIARAFAFGGHKGRALHDPSVGAQRHGEAADYMSAASTSVNHFYEKLLLLKERMSTTSGRRLAEHRHRVMHAFLDEFHAEWDSADADDGYFDERVAARYDESEAGMFDPAVVEPVVDVLAELAGSGRALELGIGTGRIALPLAHRGVPVHGIELSNAMVARLRAKPGGEEIGVTIGSFATTRVDGTFSVVYLVFNTIMNLTTQAAQVACFRNAAAHLEPGGCFVIEVGVPELQRLPPGETMRVFDASETHWGIDEYDVANQGLISHHFELVDGKRERLSIPFRYAWPAELDLMAELAGLRLRERWSDWTREPFTSDSRKHVSIWEKS
jgi:HD superfamily phosphodiesterase